MIMCKWNEYYDDYNKWYVGTDFHFEIMCKTTLHYNHVKYKY